MKKLVRDHRTIGVEIARSEIQVDNRSVIVTLYQTAPEGVPQALLGNGSLANVTETDVAKHLVNEMFQLTTQALYFGLEREKVQELMTQALNRSEQYLASFSPDNLVPARHL